MRIRRNWFDLTILPLLALLGAVGCDELPDAPAFDAEFDGNAVEPDVRIPDAEARPVARTLHGLAQEGDMVFIGEVVRIDYRMSRASADGLPALPHTFVTYVVHECYTGCRPGDEVTLRFVGGPDERGLVLLASGVPLFDVGDTDLLFVADNGRSACPLFGCADGRLRIIDDVVFSDDGREVLLSADGALRYGEQHDLEAVRTHRIGEHEFSVVRGRGDRPHEPDDDGYLSDDAVFVDSLRAQLGAIDLRRDDVVTGPTTSVDPDVPFSLENPAQH